MADSGSAPDAIDVTGIVVGPNLCEVSDALDLEIQFEALTTISAAQWEVQYLVDSVMQRHLIKLGTTDAETYAPGAHTMKFHADAIDISGIKRSRLANAGLLIAALQSGGEEVAKVNMVVQVTKEGDSYKRCIFNPLE